MSYHYYFEILFSSDDFAHWTTKDYEPVKSFRFRTINFVSLVKEYLRIRRKYCKNRVKNYDPFNITCSFEIYIVIVPFGSITASDEIRLSLYESDSFLIRRI